VRRVEVRLAVVAGGGGRVAVLQRGDDELVRPQRAGHAERLRARVEDAELIVEERVPVDLDRGLVVLVDQRVGAALQVQDLPLAEPLAHQRQPVDPCVDLLPGARGGLARDLLPVRHRRQQCLLDDVVEAVPEEVDVGLDQFHSDTSPCASPVEGGAAWSCG
jgi:hypothetical protein